MVISLVAGIAFLRPNSAAGHAGQAEHGKALNPETLKWAPAPPLLPKGAQLAVLFGDPTKSGPFIVRLKEPAGYKIPAHSHSSFEAVTIIAGEFIFGIGDKLMSPKTERLRPGGFIFLPEKMIILHSRRLRASFKSTLLGLSTSSMSTRPMIQERRIKPRIADRSPRYASVSCDSREQTR